MTPQELKNSILQLAIQGKLVEQRPEEGTAEELFRQIQAEKHALIKAGKIRKEKPLPEITEDEKPFDIPESWMWVHLNQIAESGLGKTLDKAKNTGELCPYLCSINVYWNGISLEKVKEAKFTEDDKVKYRLQRGDLLICEGGDVGRSAIWDSDEEMYYQNALHRVRFYGHVLPQYFKIVIECYKGIGIIDEYSKGMTIKHLVQNALYAMVLPLPPLAEQKRIVAKIEELLPLIDRYEQAWTRLEDFNKRFPGDMQKSILQMAIQGKLVEQRPEEGTGEELYQQIQREKQALIKAGKIKKEKPLPEITEDEIPFEIPESWKWVRFSAVIDVRDGTHDTPKYVLNGIPLVTSKNLVDGRIDFETAKKISIEDATAINMRSRVDDGDILFAMIGTIGNPVLVKKDREFSIKNMALFKQIDSSLLDMRYVLLFLQKAQTDMKAIANASVQSFVSLTVLRNYLFPLPPLAEQKRIVAKLEELLPLCKRLKS
jgi:Restriction endonuclease S subunits